MFRCVEWDDCWLWGYVKNVVELEQASDVLGIWEPLIKLIRKNPISLFRAWKSSPFINPVQTWETSRYCPVSNSVLNSLRFPDYETYLFPLPFVVSPIEMCCWINHCRFRGTPLWVTLCDWCLWMSPPSAWRRHHSAHLPSMVQHQLIQGAKTWHCFHSLLLNIKFLLPYKIISSSFANFLTTHR